MELSKKQLQLRSIILDKIYSKGPISRIDIAKDTGITPATTSSITGELIKEGLIYELGEDEKDVKVGRRKILLEVKPQHSYFIGCEISEKYVSFVLADNLGERLKEKLIEVNEQILKKRKEQVIIDALLNFLDEVANNHIKSIGFSLPGRYLEDGVITTNNPLWSNFDLNKIQDSIEIPVYFSNNVNCMALSKRLFPRNKNDENFIFFHFSRGMHCSYMYNGEIYGKANLLIGEIGHTIVNSNGELCGCGRRGCLQTYVGENNLIKKAKMLYKTPNSYLPHLVPDADLIDLEVILKAYRLGDEGIINLLRQAIVYLAQSINNLNMMIDSEKIYIHSPMLIEKELANNLCETINFQPKMLLETPPIIEIVPYSDYTGADAAVALCIKKDYLSD